MTLDEAIEHAEWAANNCEGECSEEHRQLAEWLRELRRARMEIDLLKTLRDGFKADSQKYKAENAKLRELCADMWFWSYEGHMDSESQEWQMKHIDGVLDRMRELRVEANNE